jgi:uncharacterized membrane protein YjgN (DUF898 family)
MEEPDAQESTPRVPGEPAASAPDEATATAPGEPTPPVPGERAPEPRRCRLRFTGTGQEYFSIWIVNLLLTIVTLGIYSAWAKVRKLQYFYRNTLLDGSVFDYHGNARAILKGRVLAVLLVVVYKMALTLLGTFALVVALGLIAVMPWLLTQSYRFRLHNSSYRGLRFHFSGPVSRAYLIFGLPMVVVLAPSVLVALTGQTQAPDPKLFAGIAVVYLLLMLIWPYLHFSFKRWQHGYAAYGTALARFEGHAGSFYGAYLLAAAMLLGVILIGILLMSAIGIVGGGRGGVRALGLVVGLSFVVLLYGTMIALVPFVSARTQNVVWSGTRLEGVAFASDVRASRLIGITLGNLVMILLSLGLLIPFAVIRLMKYKIEAIQVLDVDALARFVGDGQGAAVGTAGEGAVDVMDLDFGL